MRTLTIVLAAAVLCFSSAMALADNGATYYSATNPRIIQVPQRGDDARQTHASVRRVMPHNSDDDVASVRAQRAVKTDIRPQPRLPLKQQVKEHVRAPSKVAARQEPVAQPARRKPFNFAVPEPEPEPEPEPTGPRRALLSAPPPRAAGPTPRFGAPMPEAPASLTTFTPPAPVAAPIVADEPPEVSSAPAVTAHASTSAAPSDDDDDHLPPPGDPRLAPPEPRR